MELNVISHQSARFSPQLPEGFTAPMPYGPPLEHFFAVVSLTKEKWKNTKQKKRSMTEKKKYRYRKNERNR